MKEKESFNWVGWLGVALMTIGAAMIIYDKFT